MCCHEEKRPQTHEHPKTSIIQSLNCFAEFWAVLVNAPGWLFCAPVFEELCLEKRSHSRCFSNNNAGFEENVSRAWSFWQAVFRNPRSCLISPPATFFCGVTSKLTLVNIAQEPAKCKENIPHSIIHILQEILVRVVQNFASRVQELKLLEINLPILNFPMWEYFFIFIGNIRERALPHLPYGKHHPRTSCWVKWCNFFYATSLTHCGL